MALDPLKVDPTRTTVLRQQYMTDMNKRFLLIRKRITQLVVTDDAFGLRPSVNPFQADSAPIISTNAQAFRFETDANKVVKFQEWFQQQIDAEVLTTDATNGKPWSSTYVDSAYKKGLVRAYTDTHSDELSLSQDFFEGSKKQFLTEAFAAPESVSKVAMLGTRAFEQLKGVTAQMSQNINRVLSDGIARGAGARELGRILNKEVDGLTRTRARMIARTEVVHAHAEGQLDGFERLGVDEVGVFAEWHTAGDDKVCSMCAPLTGVILTIKEARGMIPRHPNCRCAWIPANVGEKQTGQIWSDEMNALTRDSLKAEFPGSTAAIARQLSRWIGAKKGKFQPKSHLKPSAKNKKFVQIQAAQKAAIDEQNAAALAAKKAAKAQAEAQAAQKAALNTTLSKAIAAPLDEKALGLIDEAKKAGQKLLTQFHHTNDELLDIGGKLASLTAKAVKIQDDVVAVAAKAAAAEATKKAKLLAALDAADNAPATEAGLAAIEKGKLAAQQLITDFFNSADDLLAIGTKAKKLPAKTAQIKKILAAVDDAGKTADDALAKIHLVPHDEDGLIIAQEQLDKLQKLFATEGLASKDVVKISEQIADATFQLKVIQSKINLAAKKALIEAEKAGVAKVLEKEIKEGMSVDITTTGPTPDKMFALLQGEQSAKDLIELGTNPNAQVFKDALTKKLSDATVAQQTLDTAKDLNLKTLLGSVDDVELDDLVKTLDALDDLDFGKIVTGDVISPHLKNIKAHIITKSKLLEDAKAQAAKSALDKKATLIEAQMGELDKIMEKGLFVDIFDGEDLLTKLDDLDEAVDAAQMAVKLGGDFKEILKEFEVSAKLVEDAIKLKEKAQIFSEVPDLSGHVPSFQILENDLLNLFDDLGEPPWVKSILNDVIAKKNAIAAAQQAAAAGTPGQAAATAAQSKGHKVKMGMAKKHYAKDKFGGGVVDADFVNTQGTKLNSNGIDKVLFEKGWHSSSMDIDLYHSIINADDLVAQKAIMDAIKKAPKGTPAPPQITPPVPKGTPSDLPLPNAADLVKVKDLAGSTRPYLAKSSKDGSLWVVKSADASGIDPAHLRSEALADELYRRAGAPVPQSAILETPSGPVKVAQFVENGQTMAEWKVGKTANTIDKLHDQIQQNFVADALFANHDVAGLSLDNLFVVDGVALRIDNGGALAFRAQGQAKAGWGSEVLELTSMRDPNINANTAAIYKTLSDETINNQIRDIVAKQDNILAAVTDDKLRLTLKARIDDLEARLPAAAKQPPIAAKARAKSGDKAAEYGITTKTAKRVKEAKANGTNFAADRGDIEDMNVLSWEEALPDGTKATKVQLKVTTQGSRKIKEVLGDELASAKAAAPQSVSNVHPQDDFWSSVLSGVKTVNHHVTDGEYNASAIKMLELKQFEIKKQLKTAKADTKKMLTHYDKAITETLAAKEAKTATGKIVQYVHKPKKAKKTAVKKASKFRVRAENDISVRTAQFKDGEITADTGLNRFSTQEAYTIDAGDGIEIKFVPNDGSFAQAEGRALHGTVNVTVPEGVSNASLKRAMQVLEDLGLDAKPPTPEYEELVYLHRNIYLRNQHNNPYYKEIWESDTLSDGEKITKIKTWATRQMDVDFNNMPSYNPQGVGLHADGSGFRHWERWDINPDELTEQMDGFALQHTTGGLYDSPEGAVEQATRAILSSGGEFTSTTGRIRKGVNVSGTGGASSEADVGTGGASYFFTRIRPDNSSTKGFFFSAKALARQDAISYESDSFGRISGLDQRGNTVKQYKSYATGRSNETIFKEGLSVDDIDFIRVRRTEKDGVIQAFKDAGMEILPDGRNIKNIITTTKNPPKARKK